jgi:hypothetical protein
MHMAAVVLMLSAVVNLIESASVEEHIESGRWCFFFVVGCYGAMFGL